MQLCNTQSFIILQKKLQIEHQEFNMNYEKLIIMKNNITTLIIEKCRLSNV